MKDLLKDLETKEATNKETVQVLKQEFIEHKTTYEKVKALFCFNTERNMIVLSKLIFRKEFSIFLV